ncbi:MULTISPECIES: RNA polymerase sigma factor [Luteibacter]|uniref:RNA polymerase sigma factor n=1 Tax=Luteibacter TaxID=242605 RepID=UPI00055EB14D|nr:MULTISPECIES: sigma-70 family RNA polymerase sigma factor [unclassified Luteibacter]
MADQARRRECEALLHTHRKILFKVAAVYARGEEDRRDLAQEIALQVWRSFASYDVARPFSTWMYRVALNVGLSHARRERERHQPLDEALIDTLDGGTPIDEPDERLALLARAIEALAPLDRALAMLYLDELPHAEIAAVLGIGESNVGTRIARLKQRLRRDMTGRASTRGS